MNQIRNPQFWTHLVSFECLSPTRNKLAHMIALSSELVFLSRKVIDMELGSGNRNLHLSSKETCQGLFIDMRYDFMNVKLKRLCVLLAFQIPAVIEA